ncbi:MAG: CHAT domain-containing protein [Gemmatimonadaceae bacterium]|nr:CHAT domain-containing protein [Gemmatimonadaceae bacterium]
MLADSALDLAAIRRLDLTAQLVTMSAFYRELSTGATPSAALLSVRRAWITAGGRQSHPSRWAPYVLVGGLDDR